MTSTRAKDGVISNISTSAGVMTSEATENKPITAIPPLSATKGFRRQARNPPDTIRVDLDAVDDFLSGEKAAAEGTGLWPLFEPDCLVCKKSV